jgi:integrase
VATYEEREGGRWRAKIRLAGHPSESDTFPTKAKAIAWATNREEEIRDGAAGRPLRKTLGQAVDKFIADVCPGHRSGTKEEARLRALIRETSPSIATLPAGKMLHSFTVADITEWRNRRQAQVSVGTVLREMTLLQSVFEHARRDWRWTTTNPFKDVRKPSKPQSRRRVISDEERDKLLLVLGYEEGHAPANLTEQIAYMLLVSLETGMRAGELNGLDWGRVNLPGRFVTLEKTKNGDSRDVPLSKRAVELLERMKGLDKARVFTIEPGTRDALFRSAKTRAGLAAVNFHDARHTAATRIGKAGKLSLLEFTSMFGWRDPRMAMVYFNPTASDLASKLD